MTPPLTTMRRDGVWSFTLNRPEKRNALSAELVERLLEGVKEAHAARAQVLVFKGEGRGFSAGFDFTGVEEQSEGDLLLRFVRIEMLLQALARSPCVTLALAHGKNFGAGVDLFAACRHRVAAPEATFRMPGLKFGLVLGTRRFSEIVGAGSAARILEESATFGAAQAAEMGFVHKIAAPEEWEQEAAAAQRTAAALDNDARSWLYDMLAPCRGDGDLAALVRSAARPGLKDRINRYLGAG